MAIIRRLERGLALLGNEFMNGKKCIEFDTIRVSFLRFPVSSRD